MNRKILNSKQIINKIKFFRKNKKKIILCHGVFDLLHLGHIHHFQKAKKLGNILIVSTTSDKHVNKGFGKPYFNLNERQEALSAIKVIDYVISSDHEDARGVIKLVRPNVYCKGTEYKKNSKDITGNIELEDREVRKYGGKISYISGKIFSSSKIVNKHTDVFDEKIKKFIQNIKRKYNFKNIQNIINSFDKFNVLVLGETIIDTYSNCEVMGKSGKEPHLVLREKNEESFIGGAASVANNISNFSKKTTFLSASGLEIINKKFIEKNLNKNIKRKIFSNKKIQTIIKKRYIDHDNTIKVLGVYKLNDKEDIYQNSQSLILKYLKKNLRKYNLVVICDYGHNLINEKIIKYVCKNKKNTTINSQINSSNINSFSLEKYKKANYLIINEREFRFEMRDQNKNLEDLIKLFCKNYKIKNLVITRGKYGSTYYDGKSFVNCPAFSNKVIDKVGAGDSFLSLFALASQQKNNVLLSLLFGSIAGAYNIENIANSKKFGKNYLLKYIDHLLK